MIADHLQGHEVRIYDIEKDFILDLSEVEAVILGGPIYMGGLPEKMRHYCLQNRDIFMTKTLGLFICGMVPEPQKQEEELKHAFPSILTRHAVSKAFLGGKFDMKAMNLFEKMVVLFLAKTFRSVNKIDREGVRKFTEQFVANL
jgi:menaquinone-dependent protoporphyrinogen oxidase